MYDSLSATLILINLIIPVIFKIFPPSTSFTSKFSINEFHPKFKIKHLVKVLSAFITLNKTVPFPNEVEESFKNNTFASFGLFKISKSI
jgi:hypothetical protein